MSFAYNASCVALGGSITLPSPVIIPSQASVALAPSGGEGQQTVKKFDYRGIITFDEASAYVTGSYDGIAFNTLATISITNLNVLNVLHVDFMVASITSRHTQGADEGEITFQGTSVDNLRIAGRRIEPRFNHRFYARYPTHKAMVDVLNEKVSSSSSPEVKGWLAEEVKKKAQGNAAEEAKVLADLGSRNVANLVADRFCFDREATIAEAPYACEPVHCSLADDIPEIEQMTPEDESISKISADDLRRDYPVRRHGYDITVVGLGKIKLAEIIIKPGERRFNMFRFALGCPTCGDLTVGSATTNGTELIP
jgi:hypothetical protein